MRPYFCTRIHRRFIVKYFGGTKNLLLWSLGVMLTVYLLDNYLFGFGPQMPVLDCDSLFYTVKGSRRHLILARSDVESVLMECHNNSAHQGTRRTQDKAALSYYWPTMTEDVNEWVRRCPECQRSNNIAAMPPPLQSITTDGRWEVLGMDLVALPETSAGNRYLLTVTDLFTKYIFLRALRDKSARSVCAAVLELFHTFGPPLRMITDQGREFVNAVNAELLRSFGVKHSVTSAYHPQCNGQAERTNQTVKQALAKYVNEQQNDWDDSEQTVSYERELVDFILASSTVKEHVTSVIQEKKLSPFQTMFKKARKTWSERSAVILQGFGPIENDDNVFAITGLLQRYVCEAMQRQKSHNDIYYITDVLYPEAVIFAIMELGGVTRDEAELLYRNYIPRLED